MALFLATGLEDKLTPSELSYSAPYLQAYNMAIECKNLGLTLSADKLSARLFRGMQIIGSRVRDIEDKRSKG